MSGLLMEFNGNTTDVDVQLTSGVPYAVCFYQLMPFGLSGRSIHKLPKNKPP